MTALDMTSLDLATLDMTAGAAAVPDAISLHAHEMGAITLVKSIEPHVQLPVQEPSSLTLALIGVGTLVAYRGIQKRITGKAAPKAAAPKLIKPRRAA